MFIILLLWLICIIVLDFSIRHSSEVLFKIFIIQYIEIKLSKQLKIICNKYRIIVKVLIINLICYLSGQILVKFHVQTVKLIPKSDEHITLFIILLFLLDFKP